MENHHAINGKTHYFDWASFNSFLLTFTRGFLYGGNDDDMASGYVRSSWNMASSGFYWEDRLARKVTGTGHWGGRLAINKCFQWQYFLEYPSKIW